MKQTQSINTMNISSIKVKALAQRNDACIQCGRELTIDEQFKLVHVTGISICDTCARLIANAYSVWHSGSALDMPITDSIRVQPKYRKKTISATLQMKVFRRDGFKCCNCGSSDDLTVDHIKPEVLGGELHLKNLQTLCRKCNSSKGASYDL